MIVRLLLPVAIVAALYLLWRIARNLEKAAQTHGGSQDRAQVTFRDAQGEPHPLQDDAGVCGRDYRRKRQAVSKWRMAPRSRTPPT